MEFTADMVREHMINNQSTTENRKNIMETIEKMIIEQANINKNEVTIEYNSPLNILYADTFNGLISRTINSIIMNQKTADSIIHELIQNGFTVDIITDKKFIIEWN